MPHQGTTLSAQLLMSTVGGSRRASPTLSRRASGAPPFAMLLSAALPSAALPLAAMPPASGPSTAARRSAWDARGRSKPMRCASASPRSLCRLPGRLVSRQQIDLEKHNVASAFLLRVSSCLMPTRCSDFVPRHLLLMSTVQQ